MKIVYNAPVTLTFSLLCLLVLLVDQMLVSGFIRHYFTIGPHLSWHNALDYVRMVSHVIGHSNWSHLAGNLTFILLLGPLLEEKYGSTTLFYLITITALATGITNLLFFNTGLFGASGIVFMMILLASMVNVRQGSIPLTFILVAAIFLGNEVIQAFFKDNISQMAHIVGGMLGSLFGFWLRR